MSTTQPIRCATQLASVCTALIFTITPAIVCAQSQPESIVRSTANRILALIDQNLETYQAEPASFYRVVEETLAPHFDFQMMSKLVLGKDTWGRVTPAQKDEFVSQFRNLLVRTYGAVLLKYRGEKLEYLKAEVLDKQGRVERVRTRVSHRDGRDDNYVDYVLVRSSQQWRVVDVLIDGVSIVTTYSATFQDSLRRHGMKELIADLRKLNETAR